VRSSMHDQVDLLRSISDGWNTTRKNPGRPSPLARVEFSAGEIVEGGKISNDAWDHIGRNPGSSPSIDIDVTEPTEHMKATEKPYVRSPADGKIELIKPEPWGTIIVRDENGFSHKMIHSDINALGPVSGTHTGISEGDQVTVGQPIAHISNKGTKNDHVHYSIITPDGEYQDPESLYFDSETGAVDGVSNEHRLEAIKEFREFHDSLGGGVDRGTGEIRYDNIHDDFRGYV